MTRYRIVLDFEGPAPPAPSLLVRYLPDPLPERNYYAQLARHLLDLDPDLNHPMTRADVADAFPGFRLSGATYSP